MTEGSGSEPREGALPLIEESLADVEDARRKALVRERLIGDVAPVKVGRYTVLRVLGSGASSVVYAAYDDQLDRKIAVKVLGVALPAVADERLRREAQALARLAHPNVVAIYETGVWEGRRFLAMELVEGQPLSEWLQSKQRSWQQIVDVFLQAGQGLAAAHALGLVHRDFKPANVVVGADDRPRVLDFGLVRLGGDAHAAQEAEAVSADEIVDESLTATGECVGTPAYMAPEQRAARAADARSDQYSFCVALHEALFGARPSGPALRAAQLRRPPPPALRRVVARGLAAAPDARWPNMNALIGALRRVRWPARRWRALLAFASTIAAIVIAALVARALVARKDRARLAAEARVEMERALIHDARLVAAAQRLLEKDPTSAAAALREVRYPEKAAGWRATASGVLFLPISRAQLRSPGAASYPSRITADGQYVVTPLHTGDVLRWRTDGTGVASRVHGTSAFEPRISVDGEWIIVATEEALVLSRADGSAAQVIGAPKDQGSFIGDTTDVMTVSTTGSVRRWRGGVATVQRMVLPKLAPWAPTLTWDLGGTMLSYARPDGWWHWPVDGSRPPQRLVARGERFRLTGTTHRLKMAWVGLEGGDLRVADLSNTAVFQILRGHSKTVVSASFSADEKRIVSGSYDGTARIWTLGSSAPPLVLRGHEDAVARASFSPDGSLVATASYDRTARLWGLDGRGQLSVLRGHRHHVTEVTFGPTSDVIVTVGIEPSLKIWDIRDPPTRVLGRHDAAIWSAALDSAGERLVTGAIDGTARIWHLDGSREPLVLRGLPNTEVYGALFSPDGQWVATGASDGIARLWRADNGELVKVIKGHAQWVYGLAFSPDGQWLATGAKEGEVRLTPTRGVAASRSIVETCPRRLGAWIELLLFVPPGDRLLSNGHGCEYIPAILDVHGKSAPLPLALKYSTRRPMAISSRQQIAIGGDEGSLSLWSTAGKKLLDFRGHDAVIFHLAFSQDGRKLVSSSVDGSARVWDVDHPDDPIILRGHEDWVASASFDDTGRRLVTASYDGTARVWNLDEPAQAITLRGHEGGLRFAAFTRRGNVVTASRDGSVRLWDLAKIGTNIDGLMHRLRQATTDCLTADQRMQYLDERAAVADARFAACERAAGR